jgi:capsular exopolysaccharide synthesis family protein
MSSPFIPAPHQEPSALSAYTGASFGAHSGGGAHDSLKALTRIVASLKRFRWLILALSLAGLGGGILATRFIKPEYEVQASVWIESPSSRASNTGPIQGEALLTSQAWVELLRQFIVLDPVVRERRLYLAAAAGPDSSLFRGFDIGQRFLPGQYELSISDDGRTLDLVHTQRLVRESAQVGDSLGRELGLLWRPMPGPEYAGKKVPFEVLTPREASRNFSSQVSSSLREDRFLTLRYADTDPDHAATTLNALVERFVSEAAKQKKQRLTLFATELDSQVTRAYARLQSAESALESFKVSTVTLPREDIPVAPGLQMTSPTVYGSYFQQRQTAEALRRDRLAIQDVLERARGGSVAVDAFNTIPSVQNAPDLRAVLNQLSMLETQLRDSLARYTEEYRGVRAVRDRIALMRTQTIPIYANALIQQLQIEERTLEQQIAAAGREMRQIPTRTIQEAKLTREKGQAEQLYNMLETSRMQARLAEASAIPEVRQFDEAVPPTRPTGNTATALIFLGLAIGLGLGLAITLLADRFDPRFRYPEQVSQGLGLPIIGTIPEIRRAKGLRGTAEESLQVIEAFRSVRLNLAHSFETQGPMALTVSSPSPGDGKSLISSNLALSFAEAGYRTILVDGDTRRGELHRTFGVDRRPGLVDALLGEAELAGIVRPTSHPELMLIPCGTRSAHSPELLGSAQMQELMTKLKDSYDVILVDSPPLGAGIDPFVLATACGNLILVLRAGETDRQLAEAKLQVLDRLPIRLLGAVLNDVRVGQGAYKYDSYSYGYLPADEPAQLPAEVGGKA